MTNNMSWKC